MTTTNSDDLYDAALKLSPDDREDLAVRLLDSLEPPDARTEEEWAEEIKRRVEDLRTGREKGIPLEEAWKIILDDSAGDDDDAD